MLLIKAFSKKGNFHEKILFICILSTLKYHNTFTANATSNTNKKILKPLKSYESQYMLYKELNDKLISENISLTEENIRLKDANIKLEEKNVKLEKDLLDLQNRVKNIGVGNHNKFPFTNQ